MSSESVKILLTGLPGCGKTTSIIEVVKRIKDMRLAGFYTQEIRQGNVRQGFSWTRLDGRTGILAHVDIRGQLRVGRYGVDVTTFERSVVPILDPAQTDVDFFVIDEIGKMECLSKDFVAAIRNLFASNKTVLATVAQKGSGLISEIKIRPDVKLFTLTQQSRDKIVSDILEMLSDLKTHQ